MIVKAHAKINLALNVEGKREDGYHELDMIMMPIELHDSIEITVLPPVYLSHVTCDDFSLESGKYNLATIAINRMKEYFSIQKSFRIHIHKCIPMSAGLGGGSANAAAVMLAINEACKLHATKEQLIEIGKSIGADVPFCLFNQPARARGIGEQLEMIPCSKERKWNVLIVKPVRGLSTKAVFAELDQTTPSKRANIEQIQKALETGDYDILKESVGNQLEAPAQKLLPEIAVLEESLRADGADIVQMSGSGSAVFAMSENSKNLKKLFQKYDKLGYIVELTKFKL